MTNTEDLLPFLKTLVKQQEEIISLLRSIREDFHSQKPFQTDIEADFDWEKMMEVGKHQKRTFNMIRRYFAEEEFTAEDLTRKIIGVRPKTVETVDWENEIRTKHYPRISRHLKALSDAKLLSVRQGSPDKGEHISQKFYSLRTKSND